MKEKMKRDLFRTVTKMLKKFRESFLCEKDGDLAVLKVRKTTIPF